MMLKVARNNWYGFLIEGYANIIRLRYVLDDQVADKVYDILHHHCGRVQASFTIVSSFFLCDMCMISLCLSSVYTVLAVGSIRTTTAQSVGLMLFLPSIPAC